MAGSDIIGIVLNSGAMHWSAISGTPSSTADVTAGIATAASAGNNVYWFTARAQRFPIIETAVLRDINRGDTPLHIMRTVEEYEYGVPDKYADGNPTAIFVEPFPLYTRITTDVQPNDMTYQIVMSVLYPAEDYDATNNTIAFPQEWYAALSWELAFRLAPSVGKWTQSMEANRQNALTLARNLNPEVSRLYFQCNA